MLAKKVSSLSTIQSPLSQRLYSYMLIRARALRKLNKLNAVEYRKHLVG